MKVVVLLDFWADGMENEGEQLDCLESLLDDLDSSGVSVRVRKIVKLED